MNNLIRNSISISVLVLSSVLSGCGDYTDYYSRVYDVCNYKFEGGAIVPTNNAEIVNTTEIHLHPECQAALESIFDIDQSLRAAPRNMFGHFLEALQVLVGYPIDVDPEYHLLGVGPFMYSADIQCIFAPQRSNCLNHPYNWAYNPNKNLFNWMANNIKKVTYSAGFPQANVAALWKMGPSHIELYDGFVNPNFEYVAKHENPFTRISDLLHETYHSVGNMHSLCEERTSWGATFGCDNDFSGAYGVGILYMESLIRGERMTDSTYHYISEQNYNTMAIMMCAYLDEAINMTEKDPRFLSILPTGLCGNFTAQQLLELEGY